MGKSKIRGKGRWPCGRIIEPKPGFEAPVEAVLGDVLQYIILKDEKSCIDLNRFLRMKISEERLYLFFARFAGFGSKEKRL